MTERDFVKDLRDIKHIFDKAKVIFWLDAGTLLGAVRDKKIIPWDNDLDISIMHKNHKKVAKLTPEFKKKRFEVSTDYYKDGSLRKLKLKRAKNFSIDIVFIKVKNNMAWYYLKFTERKEKRYKILRKCAIAARRLITKIFPAYNKSRVGKLITKIYFSIYKGTVFSKKSKHSKMIPYCVPLKFYTKLNKIRFYGMEFNTPNNVGLYLSKRYGKNWKVPKKDWSYWADDGFRDPKWVKKRKKN